jgi:hypothetical protein
MTWENNQNMADLQEQEDGTWKQKLKENLR